jgi:hypothetical protein
MYQSKHARKNYYLVKDGNKDIVSKHFKFKVAKRVANDVYKKRGLIYRIYDQDGRAHA